MRRYFGMEINYKDTMAKVVVDPKYGELRGI
jgi:hypothetical protein